MAITFDRDIRRIQNTKESSVASGDSKTIISHSPAARAMSDGEQVFAQESNKPLALYRKNKGALWKVYLSKDGNQIIEKDLDVKGILNIEGRREEKKQPSFLAYNSAADANWSTGSYATIEFNTEVFDVGDNFASSTFTAPVTGKYFLHTSVGVSQLDTAATYYSLKLVTAGSATKNYFSILDPNFAADTGAGLPMHLFQITSVAHMEAADTALVQLLQTGGTAQSDIAGDSSELYTWFTGYLLG